MKKINRLLPLLAIILSSCNGMKNNIVINDNNDDNPITINEGKPFRYTPAEEEIIVINQPGLEVFSIEVINIPETGIKACCWNDYGIKLRVTYNDSSTKDFDFKEKHIPIPSRHYLGEVGHHNIEIALNGIITKFGFDIYRNPDFAGFHVQFVNSRDSQILHEYDVGYYQNAVYPGILPGNQTVDEEHISRFARWDYPLEYIHQDMVFTTVYRNEEKRFYGDIPMTGDPVVMKSVKDGDNYSVLAYLGRIHNAALYSGEIHRHVMGQTGETLGFRGIDNYSNDWNELNESILNYGINYQYNPTYTSYLFGSNGPFTNNPNFLNNFETIYGSLSSKSVLLDTGSLVDTAVAEPYENCYYKARNYLSSTKTIEDEDETGYYRIAVTCHFDIYVSMTFAKVGTDKYSFIGNSKYIYSPVLQKAGCVLQYSTSGKFINTFEKKVTFSNEKIYNIANGLDWGN